MDALTAPENNNPQQPSINGMAKRLLLGVWEVAKVVIIAALIVLPIRYFLFQPFIVKGDSMVPNFHSGDYLIVDEISYRFGDIERGDVVVLKYPLDAKQRFIKRVIALPGETVDVSNGKVTVTSSGKAVQLDEKNYLHAIVTTGTAHVTLAKDEYFVMGDNRQFSYDSRSWGVLPKDDIIGRALLRIFPLSSLSYIADPTY